MNYFKQNIRHLRSKKEMNQTQFAEYIGVTKPRYASWEIGQSYPQIDALLRLGEFFDVSLFDLFLVEFKDGYKPYPFNPSTIIEKGSKGELSIEQVEQLTKVRDTIEGILTQNAVGDL
ncbi:helix-turn-helix transcriptional regulator [Carboxylicivirga sp. RSCT41]|uniref:helix-turn-helix transcriptional regulator n=1 Tax=Carboxylicivirga agarovorans TaxID=3417570 RepID=UPI003D339CA3